MTADMKSVLKRHALWVNGDGGSRADLSGANLRYADLSDANLSGANLSYANLRDANLSDANLSYADPGDADLSHANLRDANLSFANLSDADLSYANLRGANLGYANLSYADLSGAYLSGANLIGAYLSGANLRGAHLSGANLRGAHLSGARLPHFSICPEIGSFTAWKKLSGGNIALLQIPADARRTSSLVGRKCRAEFVYVVSITNKDGDAVNEARSTHDLTVYKVGEIVHPDSFNDDIRVECTNGIHFFITKREAEEY